MAMEAGMPVEPSFDVRVLVRGVVVHDQMQIEVLLHGPVDLLQERQELLGAVLRLARAVGIGRAKELALLNDEITAAEARAIGLVNWVVPPGEFEAARKGIVGDRVIIFSYGYFEEAKAGRLKPRVIKLDGQNRIVKQKGS